MADIQCRSDWGWALVRGRIRAWDGLASLALEYPQHAMSKWLWRGYLHTGGHLLGRWRDSVTDEHLRGEYRSSCVMWLLIEQDMKGRLG